MVRTIGGTALLSFLAVTAVGCADSRPEGPRPFFLYSTERTEAAAAPTQVESAPPAQPAGEPATAPEPSVLFIAYVATPPDVVDTMLKLAHVTKRDVVYDLGCGDGRIVVTAARRYHCRAVGYDIDAIRVQEARKNARDNRVAHLVRIEQKEIHQADLSDATVVALYLGPDLNASLVPQLARLGAGARIISHDFGLGDIPPDKVVEMTSGEDHSSHTIYLWNCPLKVTGKTPAPVP